jgi:hypothetical protein
MSRLVSFPGSLSQRRFVGIIYQKAPVDGENCSLASRDYPSFRLVTEMHPGLGHSDAAAATLAIGMLRLSEKQPPPD